MHHFQNVVIVHVITTEFKSSLELFEVDGSVLILVNQGEDSSDSVLGSDLSDWSSGEFDELIEFNGSVGFFEFVDDTNDEWVSSINS